MARTLLLLRHAKSAWPDDVTDHGRPLTTRGRRDAEQVGHWLQDSDMIPELALVSSAQRTRETYECLAGVLDAPPKLQVTDGAYAVGAGELLDLVHWLPADVARVVLIAHNPGIATLANLLDDESTDVPERSDMRVSYRTAACAAFEIDGDWADADPATAHLLAFTVPRG